MNDSLPSVSVVIPALNASEVIGYALDSIDHQVYPAIIEVIVVAGDHDTGRIAADRGVRVVDNPNGRTPHALNLGFEAARGDVVVRCDAQSELPSNYISRAVETMQRTGAVNVGGMQVPSGDTYWERGIGAAMASPLGAGDARYRIGGEAGPAETVYLGVFDREAVEMLGGFDEEFIRNQDYELNQRIIDSGAVVWFDPELKVRYRPRGSLRDLWSQYFQYGKAKKKFVRRHPGSLRWRQLAAPLLVLVLMLSLTASFVWPWALVVPAGYIASLVVGTLAGRKNRGSNLATVPALVVMHLAWGLGFLASVD